MEIEKIESLMPDILIRNFTNGFCKKAGGIYKSFDLLNRRPVNSDMPWWSLPETIRAALECYKIVQTKSVKEKCLEIVNKCHYAFTKNYIRTDLYLMPIQTRTAEGTIANTIPAVPDADPGYHTGLCLIDCMRILKKY